MLTREIFCFICFVFGSGVVFQVFIAAFVYIFITLIREVLFTYKHFSEITPRLRGKNLKSP